MTLTNRHLSLEGACAECSRETRTKPITFRSMHAIEQSQTTISLSYTFSSQQQLFTISPCTYLEAHETRAGHLMAGCWHADAANRAVLAAGNGLFAAELYAPAPSPAPTATDL